jgi:3-oxoacyl-[acyl-carrier protein] reductase
LIPKREELDLFSEASIDNYCSRLKCPVDILINNAGINIPAKLEALTEENIDATLKVNLLAPLKISLKLLPRMIKNKYGRIVNIGSIWGLVTRPGRTAYTVTKAGLLGLTKSLAVELAPHNILVNYVAPGYVNTELTEKNNNKSQLREIKKKIPLGRLCEPGEVAELVSFLCSDKNTYITGQVIAIDGGYLCL